MKKSFTIVELLVVMIIVTTLVSIAQPTYEKYILKARVEEVKSTIVSIAFAEERYHQEMGNYYPLSSTIDIDKFIKNEDDISRDLKIDLKNSNNFIYMIKVDNDGNYVIKAIMRRTEDLCQSGDDKETICKQTDTSDIDEWGDSYGTFNEESRYIEFKYPIKFTGEYVEEGINYENLF